MSDRVVPLIASVWALVVLTGAFTIALKGAGPALLGGEPLPDQAQRLVALLAPTLLAALVATQVFAEGQRLVVDARLAGVAAAAVALWLRMPVLAVVVIAAAMTAAVRLFT